MVRTKIEINVSALGQRTKTMNMIIGSNTTALNVVHKVLEKFQVQDPVTNYQLMAVAKNDAGSQGTATDGKGLYYSSSYQTSNLSKFVLVPTQS